VRTADEDHTSSDIALRDAQKNLPTGKIGLVISIRKKVPDTFLFFCSPH
jgi:hypothetical protein